MQSHGLAKLASIDALGFESLKTTVSGSGASIAEMSAYAACLSDSTPAGGFLMRSYVARTSSEVKFEPSCHFTPLRSLNV